MWSRCGLRIGSSDDPRDGTHDDDAFSGTDTGGKVGVHDAADQSGQDAAFGAERDPTSGDLVLASVVEVKQHKRIEQPGSRMSILFPGDEIIVAYGNRYAPDQFEAVVPATLEACNLVAAGGVAGTVVSSHVNPEPPTTIEPIGLIADEAGRNPTILSSRHR